MNQNQPAQPNNNPNFETQKQYHEPTDEEKSIELNAFITPQEKEYYDSFTSIISKLKLQEDIKIVQENSLSAFIRTAMAFMSNWYTGTAFRDSNLIGMLPNKDAKLEFIAFRKKYMNFPVDAQMAELKRLGHVKPKK